MSGSVRGVPHVEPLGKSRHETDGKFQSLTFMDGHNANQIRIFVQYLRLAVIHLVLLDFFQIPDEVKQPVKAGFLKGVGFLHEKFHIGTAFLPRRQGRHILEIVAFPEQGL